MIATPAKTRYGLEEVETTLLDILRDGLGHGFSEFSVTIETGKAGNRRVFIQAGNSHVFYVDVEELR